MRFLFLMACLFRGRRLESLCSPGNEMGQRAQVAAHQSLSIIHFSWHLPKACIEPAAEQVREKTAIKNRAQAPPSAQRKYAEAD